MDSLYWIIGIVSVVLIGGFIALPYAKSKGIISKTIATEIAEDVDKAVDVVAAIVNTLDEKKIDIKAVNTVLDVADIVTDYVVDIIDLSEEDEKVALSLEVVDKVLKEIGISPTKSQQNLIDTIVKHGVSILKEKNV